MPLFDRRSGVFGAGRVDLKQSLLNLRGLRFAMPLLEESRAWLEVGGWFS
jgi:hypothetical protein